MAPLSQQEGRMATQAPTKSDQVVSKPSKNIIFMARRSELKLVKKPERPKRNETGELVDIVPGERVAFKDGKLEVPPTGKLRGEKGEELVAKEVLDWLLGSDENQPHHLLNDKLEGFWKLEEPAPAPSEDELNHLQDLAMDLDLEGLKQFIAQEQEGWKRPSLLRTATKSLESATEKLKELQEAAEAKAKPASEK